MFKFYFNRKCIIDQMFDQMTNINSPNYCDDYFITVIKDLDVYV